MGSKNKIADWVVDNLPPAEHFYDLFCGGCAVTHAAMFRHKYKTYHVNDITDMGLVFQKLVTEGYKPDYHWVSREEFNANKEKDLFMAINWSYGNNGYDYMFGKDKEPIIKAGHYAVCFEDYSLADELGINLHGLEGISGIKERYTAYKKLWKEKSQSRADIISVERHIGNARLFGLERLSTMNAIKGGGKKLIATKGDYQNVDILPGSVVYCDIPYKGTGEYLTNKESFDHERFYKWCLSREYPVFVSEYQMPPEFKPIAKRKRTGTMGVYNNEVREEVLYVQAKYAEKYKRDLFI